MKIKKPKEVLELQAKGWDSILHTGTFIDASGKEVTFTKADLSEIAKNYDPTQEEAPIVIGHPKTNAPAWGWVEEVQSVGDWLLAKYHKVDDNFKAAVNEGRFNKRSVRVRGNHLEHVGYLGGALPAVPGLGSATFTAPEGSVQIELAMDGGDSMLQWKLVSVGRTFQRLREKFIQDGGDTGIETADKLIPQWLIDDLMQEPKPVDNAQNAFSEPETTLEDEMTEAEKAKLSEAETKNTELSKENADLKASIAKQKKDAWEAERGEFTKSLISKGLILGAEVETVNAMLDAALEKGQGEFSKEKNPHLDQVKTLLLSGKPKVHVGTDFAKDGDHTVEASEFSGPVDSDKLELHNKATALSKEQKISYREAVMQLQKDA